MGLFDKIQEADMSVGGVYLNGEHNYLLEIAGTKIVKGRKDDNFYVAEFVVHESDDPKLQLGSKPSWVTNMKQDAALGNIKMYVAAAMGIDPKNEAARVTAEITADVAELVVTKNTLRGRFVRVSTKQTTTRAGNPFTKHFWDPTTHRGASLLGAAPPIGTPAPGQALPNLPAPLPPGLAAAPPPPPPPPPAQFPPNGWAENPNGKGWYYQKVNPGGQQLTEAQLRALPPS
jgi:hypothetical protein